jgi:hypothetical protein
VRKYDNPKNSSSHTLKKNSCLQILFLCVKPDLRISRFPRKPSEQ